MMLLAAALALHVDLADDAALRVASTGTGTRPVSWSLAGGELAWTDDTHAALLDLPAGEHTVWATSASSGAWRALARIDAPGQGEAAYVPAWTASHASGAADRPPLLPLALALLAAGTALARRRRPGRSLLEAADGPTAD